MTPAGGAAFGLDGDFTAAYLAVRRVADLAERDLSTLSLDVVTGLEALLGGNVHGRQTQARVLYREAAGVLAALLAEGSPELAAAARRALGVALAVPGKPRLAAAEAVGRLPLAGVRGPVVASPGPDAVPIGLAALLARAGASSGAAVRVAGRSLLLPSRRAGWLVVLKRLRQGEDPAGLAREAAWMEHCAGLAFPASCHVPFPYHDGAAMLWAVPDIPGGGEGLDLAGRCLAFTAHETYFRYPNEPAPQGIDAATFAETMGRSALLLGWLAGRGIIHEAAIPLFHNRVQRERREDGGVYDWRLPGRLDRWLSSSRHPNFGRSGVRDFEHLAAYDGAPGRLYRRMGDHFVSLFLVAGSTFRMRAPERVGTAPDGRPVDVRALFDEDLLARVVEDVFVRYHEGFVGRVPRAVPYCSRTLARRMVEEMGVDRHMTELLRVADQEAMDDAAFVAFLRSRGLSPERASRLRRGEADVALETGPHLGDFNNRTSLPELNEAAAAAVAVCLAARQEDARRVKPV